MDEPQKDYSFSLRAVSLTILAGLASAFLAKIVINLAPTASGYIAVIAGAVVGALVILGVVVTLVRRAKKGRRHS
jgi:uncharacterized membrane protein YeaQ/YmgE (transglycosylase-associated protein family)